MWRGRGGSLKGEIGEKMRKEEAENRLITAVLRGVQGAGEEA